MFMLHTNSAFNGGDFMVDEIGFDENLEMVFDCGAFCRHGRSPRCVVHYDDEDICILGHDCPVVQLYRDEQTAVRHQCPPGYGIDMNGRTYRMS